MQGLIVSTETSAPRHTNIWYIKQVDKRSNFNRKYEEITKVTFRGLALCLS